MGQYVKIKHAANIMKIKYSFAGQRERKRLGIDSVEEHLNLFKKEIETASGKTIAELLEGDIAGYNEAMDQAEKKDYMLQRMGIARNYLLYKKEDLYPYLDENGNLDQEKAQKRIDEIENHELVLEVKNDQKLKAVNEYLNLNLSEKQYEPIDRSDLKKYFPEFKNIEQYSNIIFLEHDEYEWDTLDVASVMSLRNDTNYMDKSTYKLTKEGKLVLEEISNYLEKHGIDKTDKYAYMEWYYRSMREASNYHGLQFRLARGSQYYINRCIDDVEDKEKQEELKKYEFTSLISVINPVGPNIRNYGGWAENIKYEEVDAREEIYTFNYDDLEYVKNLVAKGKKVNILGVVNNKFEVVKKYNQD